MGENEAFFVAGLLCGIIICLIVYNHWYFVSLTVEKRK